MIGWRDHDEHNLEEGARKAGFRATKFSVDWPQPVAIDIDASFGTYPIDDIAADLDRKRMRGGDDCTDALWLGHEPYRVVRSFLNPDNLLNLWIEARHDARDQAPRDARAMVAKANELIEALSDFITHSPADNIDQSSRNHIGFDEVRASLSESIRMLEAIKDQQPTKLERKSKEKLHIDTFLLAMANAYSCLTGRQPGKTPNGLFARFCLLAWKTFGWPGDDDSIRSQLGYRIGTGVHKTAPTTY